MSRCHRHDTDHHPWNSATRKIEKQWLHPSLLAQFGLTPKFKRGLGAGEGREHTTPLDAL